MNFNPVKHFLHTALQGLFGLLPILVTAIILFWLYAKIDQLTGWMFKMVGFTPENHQFLWFLLALFLFTFMLYLMGHLMQTRLIGFFESLLKKIPGYQTIKEIINIFNSSKEGENRVLVVAIRGFGVEGYNIGLMYSQKESIIKDHYTVTLSMSPIPNGGFMFEVHQNNIYVIDRATFDDNLQYLLSMGVKSFADILKTEAKTLDELVPLSNWLEVHKNNQVKNVL
ncbi:MAG TPA: DUF502 domain-containing protein [Sulfurovum sp.]|jgi:uncharacterized membrane protein|nr:MAG: hypothetical protein B7Y63_02200 [Sulfurovum sp. 35-42-20]OYY55489.1 MAG: hypothetical protein B7Y52_05430 [Sulfurovum sp. 28-43-6]OYZ26571.1 MAG: hypothetical protein B7Y23_00885 [Sulfurovum sp. 16-42-52]OYZ50658.1 MAG: hypothetical protein B7Y13_00210 [Sulfurovum sp. 24-42-9]OZA47146.1 MAG: hypothetical protein B7X80_00630 [Sulfurovum sp. 17-42-90]OZA59049.1 MAG: hypothetical protein B7X69_09490 [Sulfurovum sp. 39-42-12]HQR73449.1 DUF502 domain-containing protein [Sulfurovum sp.]